ncbi:hypothetical protein HAX54_052831, partial [Datura stramonium]|nr:hypothetical protein [Datura stramonium]
EYFGAQDGPTTSGRVPKKPVPQPPSMETLEEKFTEAIQMLTQLVLAQSGCQNLAPVLHLINFRSTIVVHAYTLRILAYKPPKEDPGGKNMSASSRGRRPRLGGSRAGRRGYDRRSSMMFGGTKVRP